MCGYITPLEYLMEVSMNLLTAKHARPLALMIRGMGKDMLRLLQVEAVEGTFTSFRHGETQPNGGAQVGVCMNGFHSRNIHQGILIKN